MTRSILSISPKTLSSKDSAKRACVREDLSGRFTAHFGSVREVARRIEVSLDRSQFSGTVPRVRVGDYTIRARRCAVRRYMPEADRSRLMGLPD